MEKTGGLGLGTKNLSKLKEVWKLMVDMEEEILQEFDLRHEADCQQKGHGSSRLDRL